MARATYLCVVPADLLRGSYRVGVLVLGDRGEYLEFLLESEDLLLGGAGTVGASQLLSGLLSDHDDYKLGCDYTSSKWKYLSGGKAHLRLYLRFLGLKSKCSLREWLFISFLIASLH